MGLEFSSLDAADLDVRKALAEAANAAGGKLFPLDLLAWAAANRTASLLHAFRGLLEARNFWAAAAVLRMQIDTLVRFRAAWHVADPHDYAAQVLRGVRINRLKDRDGKLLTDKHLVQIARSDAPWIERVYDETSGFVHLSSVHIFAAGEQAHDDGSIELKVSELDPERLPDEARQEAIDCYTDVVRVLIRYLLGWAQTKHCTDLAQPDA